MSLRRWFKEKWVDVKTGKPCGRQISHVADRKAKSVKATPLVVHLVESHPKHQRLLKRCLRVKNQSLEKLKQVHVELTTTTNGEKNDALGKS